MGRAFVAHDGAAGGLGLALGFAVHQQRKAAAQAVELPVLSCDGVGELVAEARIRFKFVREGFTTRVTLDKSARTIDVTYLSGPFHDLANHWRFHELEDGSTLVDFWIRYGFKNPVLQMLLDGNRSRAIRYLISAFEDEAANRYQQVGAQEFDLGPALAALPEPSGASA